MRKESPRSPLGPRVKWLPKRAQPQSEIKVGRVGLLLVWGRCRWHNQRLRRAGTTWLRSWTKRLLVSPNREVGCVSWGGAGESGLCADQTCALLAATPGDPGRGEAPPSAPSDTTVEGTVGRGHCVLCPVFCPLGPSIPLTPGDTPVRKKEEVLFDEEDDVVATLGFTDSPTAERRQTGDQ